MDLSFFVRYTETVKKSQLVMIWLLPLVLIGGFFSPVFGYLVLGMMLFFLPLALFKGRWWCWNLCPRGAFLDLVMSHFSRNKPLPGFLTRAWFRWLVFVMFICFFIYLILRAGGNWLAIGAVFVSMCLITTVVAIILGIAFKHRGWCMVCPMGFLQEKLGRLNKKK